MNLAQINRLFMFLASTDIKTTDNYNSDIVNIWDKRKYTNFHYHATV